MYEMVHNLKSSVYATTTIRNTSPSNELLARTVLQATVQTGKQKFCPVQSLIGS